MDNERQGIVDNTHSPRQWLGSSFYHKFLHVSQVSFPFIEFLSLILCLLFFHFKHSSCALLDLSFTAVYRTTDLALQYWCLHIVSCGRFGWRERAITAHGEWGWRCEALLYKLNIDLISSIPTGIDLKGAGSVIHKGYHNWVMGSMCSKAALKKISCPVQLNPKCVPGLWSWESEGGLNNIVHITQRKLDLSVYGC